MSAGHGDFDTRGLSAVVINRLLDDPEVKKHFLAPYEVNKAFDLPYLAGYSKDGKTRYIDRHLPELLECEGRKFDPTPHLCDHEGFEKAVMEVLGWAYKHAHEAANGYERRGVMKAGLLWGPYNAALAPYVKSDEHERLERVPPDLDMAPYNAPPVDKRLLAHMKKAMGNG